MFMDLLSILCSFHNFQTILFGLPHLPVFGEPGRGQTVISLPDFRMIILRGECYVNNVPSPNE